MSLDLGPLFSQHPLPHILFDLDSLRIVDANAAAARRYGWPVERLQRMSWAEILLPCELPALRRFVDGLPDSAEQGPERVWREQRADGTRLFADVRGVPWTAEGGGGDGGSRLRLVVILDAGDRTELMQARREEAELFSAAERVARVGGWRVNLATGAIARTATAWAIHGVTLPADRAEPPEGSARTSLASTLDCYPGEARETARSALEACARDGIAFDVELPFVDLNGRSMWVRVTGAPVRDADGAVVGLQGAIQDISASKRVELALRASQERLQATLRALPDLFFVFDAEDRYAEVSDPDHPSMSHGWPEKVGRRLQDTVSPELAAQMVESARLARASGQVHSYLYDMSTRDGSHRHFEGRTVPLEDGRWMSLVRDVTETVHLERRFRLLAESLPMAVFESDAQGQTRWVNEQWQRLYGMPEPLALGSGWLQGVHPQDREGVRRAWYGSVGSGERYTHENRIVRPDGSVRSVRVDSIAVRRTDGQLLGRVGVVVDLTQSRELDEARRAREVAEQTQRHQTAFLSRLSHELRTPLNAIIGFTELLILAEPTPSPGAPTPPVRGARLAYVRDAGKHMLALVDDLLELQRLQQPSFNLRPEPVDLGDALNACAAMLDPLARSRGVQFDVELPERSPMAVIDRRALRQVLLNLGSNAVKYGRAGGCVQLRVLPGDSAGLPGWRIEVQDDGEGLSEPAMQRLFQPFERLGRERGDQPGAGLGLVISRQLAQLLGGSLELRSRAGQGTTACLHVPADARARPGIEAPAPPSH